MKRKALSIVLRTVILITSVLMIYWYSVSTIFNIGTVLGNLFFAWAGANCIFWNKISSLIQKMKQSKTTKIIYKVLCVLFAVMLLWVAVILGAMAYFATRPPKDNATVVVLGCQVRGDTPSLLLYKRIETAFEYLKANPNAKCIASGGKGSDENISEAECIKEYLVDMGIDENRILIENKSVNTNENISFSAEIIKKNGLNENMAIVTDGFHEMRATLIAKRLGYECGAVSSKTPMRYVSAFTTREVIALTATLLLNR